MLRIVKSPHLSEKSSDFDEICYTKSDLELDDSHLTKYIFFKLKIADGRHVKYRFWP